MWDITAFVFLACVVKHITGQHGPHFHDNGRNPQRNNGNYKCTNTNCSLLYLQPTSCSDNLCNQERIRTASGTSVNQPANHHGPVKIPNKAPVPSRIPLNPHMILKKPHQAPILPKPPRERLAAKTPAKLFKHAEPSINAAGAAKGKPPKRSKYA
ncbi:hypothetical protein ACJMK2_034387 [Sinanodonta woodiana]|uniref:Secreted protein n=1 Tax=Sinanodonta woodiana TaxID=1069815 RepID=A0ABD3WRD5_SINWO